MRNFLGTLVVGSCLLGLPLPAVANDDPDYNPAQNFRPQNITGLDGIYAWVGSYYNATTQVDLIVERGYNGTTAPCAPLQNQTITMQWDSILAILDRGEYNKGSDSVNVMLTLMPPNFNKSKLNLPTTGVSTQPLWWALQSSEPTWQPGENTTVEDHFNFTTTKLLDSFSLAGTLAAGASTGDGAQGYEPISMPTCNSSYYNGNYTLSISELPGDVWWSTQGWTDYTIPSMNATFNENTANFTLEGKFAAYPYLRANDTGYTGTVDGGEISIGDSVQGTIRFTFKGGLDTYHSDVLNMNTTTPTWLRTVGFGNNSLNAGYTSGGQGRPGVGAGVIVALFSIFAMLI